MAFSVLPPPHHIEEAYQINVESVEQIIRQLSDFNFTILDLTSVFSTLNLAMLDLSTVINYLGSIDFLPAIKNYRIGYDMLLRFEYEESKIRLIESRSTSQKFIHVEDVERLLGSEFYHHLPNDFASADKSIRMGRPLMFSAPFSDLTKSYQELVMRYIDRDVDKISSSVQGGREKFLSGFINKFRKLA